MSIEQSLKSMPSRRRENSVRPRLLNQVHPDPLALPDEALAVPRSTNLDTIGRVNTPPHVARWMVDEAFQALAEERPAKNWTILEPAAGSGVILGACAQKMLNAAREYKARVHLCAIDNDEAMRAAACKRLALLSDEKSARRIVSKYRVGDALLSGDILPSKPLDLVIGNPPYLGVRHARRLPTYTRWAERFGVKEDLYAFFMRWAINAVRPGGFVILLVPDTWMHLNGYQSLRGELLQGRLRLIVRLPADTFDRYVLPCFFLWQKAAPQGTVRFIDHQSGKTHSRPMEYAIPQNVFNEMRSPRIFVPTPHALRLHRTWAKLHRNDQELTLDQIAMVRDAGIHSRNCRHHLFFATRQKPGLDRLLQGRQIERYAVRWDSPKAQYRWVDIHYRPRSQIAGRRGDGRPSVRGEYWEWQGDPALHRLPERILVRQTGDRIVAARCTQKGVPHYTDNTLFTILLNEQARTLGITFSFLLGYLNSDIVSELYRFSSGEEGRSQAQIKIKLLRCLPFPQPARKDIAAIDSLVKKIERHALRGRSTEPLDRAIDEYFRKLLRF